MISQFPHCDARVLHAPGKCEYCDLHPDWQELRKVWNVNFTGQHFEGKTVCPAEYERGMESLNGWHGNVPLPTAQEVKDVIS